MLSAGDNPSPRENFSSSYAFILAALGSAVGLGNIWRFPYIAGENGGGAFVLVYLLCVFSVGLPALIATVMIGRRGAANPIRGLGNVAHAEGLSHHWRILGWMLVLGAFLLLSLFSVIASWIIDYLLKAVSGALRLVDAATATDLFDDLKADIVRLAVLHGLFISMALVIVAKGVRKGIERAVRALMPALFVLMLGLAIHAMLTGAAAEAMNFLFYPDFSDLGAGSVLLAVGQALLTLSVGGAGMLVYGAYLSREASVPGTCLVIGLADTSAALLAGLMIFPVVFAYGLTPEQGPGLIFVTLPVAFAQMTGGTLFAVAFFLLLLIAALTSAISMLEPVIAWLTEHHGIRRIRSALLAGALLWLLGLVGVLSFNVWADVRPLESVARFASFSIFQSIEFTVASVAFPISTFLLAVFAGWMISENSRKEEFGGEGSIYSLWRRSLRLFVPAVIVLVFGMNLAGA